MSKNAVATKGLASMSSVVTSAEKVGPLAKPETIAEWLTALTTPDGRATFRNTRGSVMSRLATAGQMGSPAPILPNFTEEKGFHWSARTPKRVTFPVTSVPAHVREWAYATLSDATGSIGEKFHAAEKTDDGTVLVPAVESGATRAVAAFLLIAFDPASTDDRLAEAFGLLGIAQPTGFDVSRAASLAGKILFPKEG